MVTKSDPRPYLMAMRQFMTKTREPGFRSYLQEIGWTSDADIVIAFDAETIASLVSRLAYNEATNPCLVAIPYENEQVAFRLMFMEAVRPSKRDRRRHPREEISPQATIGMLYSSLDVCDAYVPSEWTPGVTFSRVPEPA